MKKFFTQAALSLLVGGAILSAVAGGPEAPPMMIPGFYIGLGGAYDSYYSKNSYSTNSTITNNLTNQTYTNLDFLNGGYTGSGNFSNRVTQNQFGAMVQIGYWSPMDSDWIWGLQASYKYTNYSYNTSMNAADQNFASQAFNANSGSSLTELWGVSLSPPIPDYLLSQTSLPIASVFNTTTSFNNELLLLAYFGMQFDKGFAYLGLGAVMFTYKDNLQVSSLWNLNFSTVGMFAYDSVVATNVAYTTSSNPLQQVVIPDNNSAIINTPVFIASSGPQSKSSTIWGGAFQVGCNYYFLPTWFLNVNYTYTLTGTYKFTTTIANPNVTWFNNPIPSTSQWANTAAAYSGTTLQSTLNTSSFNSNNSWTFSNLSIARRIQLEAQEFMFSINKVFEL